MTRHQRLDMLMRIMMESLAIQEDLPVIGAD
jgi:hypothetical protein